MNSELYSYMIQLIWKLVLPLTIISFVTVTKWWSVAFIDGPHEVLKGFPFPYVCRGWHTSMSLQIYVLEFIADIFIYFSFWFLVVYGFHRFIVPIHLSKRFSAFLLVTAGIVLILGGIFLGNPNNMFKLQRKDEIVIEETGVHFIWEGRGENE